MGASWVTEGMNSRYDVLLTFSGVNCERDRIREKLIIWQVVALYAFSVDVAAGDADGADCQGQRDPEEGRGRYLGAVA
jgi:hypothetical protein